MPSAVFDFRDPQFEEQRKKNAPSQSATTLRDQTRSALATVQNRSDPGSQPNSFANILQQRDPFPDRGRTEPNITVVDNQPTPTQASRNRADDLFAEARGTRNLADRSALLRQALGEQDFARAQLGSSTDLDIAGQRVGAQERIADSRSATDLGIANLRDRGQRDISALDSLTRLEGDQTRAQVAREGDLLAATTSRLNTTDRLTSDEAQLARRLGQDESQFVRGLALRKAENTNFGSVGLDTVMSELSLNPAVYRDENGFTDLGKYLLSAGFAGARNEQEKNVLRQIQGNSFAGGGIVGMADGGIVPPAPGGVAGGALGPVTPSQPDPEAVSAYQRYAKGATAMGLTTVGFDEFMSMRQSAQPVGAVAASATGAGAPVAMAEGGMVPGGNDVSGKMVVDSDPNAPTDSIPAVIDGQRPAALDSGEMVFPRSAVLYYGTDKLNKMIEKAKMALEGGDGQSAGQEQG